MDSPIAKLGPEILLEIFEWLSQDGGATLVPSALCCRKWLPLVLSVLYGDVVLTPKRLAKFGKNCADHRIRSLTLRLDVDIDVNPYDPSEAQQTVESRLQAVRQLCRRIMRMSPAALSILVSFPCPIRVLQDIPSILGNLPACCESLEVDVTSGELADPHLCDSIRAILPRLQHLRLRLPILCPAIFSAEPLDQNAPSQVIRAPKLKTCVINVSRYPPDHWSYMGAWATPCNCTFNGPQDQTPCALPPILPALKDFARLNSTNLERLWVMDVEAPHPSQPRSWAAWVRRDFISNTSHPIPVTTAGGVGNDPSFARVPSPKNLDRTQDWFSSPEGLEMLAEGRTWVGTTSGARLPITMLREHQETRRTVTRELFQKRSGITCMLWRKEDESGEKLLPEGPGELMQKWNLKERTLSGWTRDEHDASPYGWGVTRFTR
ncbi:hypothetical protein F5Y05DRAFT_409791 [Hypoxylon sp. FL0543]|nr:hypothetical protein F5Y05DRAFT_409791 [Hypoxylon sp. FL0543]